MSPKGNIVLQVYIHCPGCEETVVKSLRGYDGVEGIEVDSKNHIVIVKGEKADPTKVAKRLRKKSGKYVKLISPIPPKDKKEEKKEEKREVYVPKGVEVVLKVHLHCEGCAKDVKHCIHKMPGVRTVEPNMEKNMVTVKGGIEPQKLVEFVKKRAGKHAEIEIVKPEKQKQSEDKKNGKECETEKHCNKSGGKEWYANFCPELVYAPQLFSDENPNACSIM
ncbi:heavy metal-associated isoprenylated plant protein 8-like [Coffea arabica]|uniref:Heavy metal-associated isoprenylated plant protein 8-like n=1 Tax=Coffea arabica TaxID=13443 RepID=A0ABM4WBG0_COFAR